MLPCGKEHFTATDNECLNCNDHIKCFETRIKSTPGCNLLNLDYGKYCSNSTCSYEMQQLCQRLAPTYQVRKDGMCSTFGDKANQRIENCLECDEKIFKECELAELQLFNFKLRQSELKDIIDEELEEVKSEIGTCYGTFAFEDICFNSCDFKIKCMRESGIRTNGECMRFPKKSTEKPTSKDFNSTCTKCPIYKHCNDERTERYDQIKKEIEQKKMFSSFYTLQEIRTQFTTERR